MRSASAESIGRRNAGKTSALLERLICSICGAVAESFAVESIDEIFAEESGRESLGTFSLRIESVCAESFFVKRESTSASTIALPLESRKFATRDFKIFTTVNVSATNPPRKSVSPAAPTSSAFCFAPEISSTETGKPRRVSA